MKLIVAIGLLVTQLSFTTSSSVNNLLFRKDFSPTAWMELGSRTVNYGTDHDVITNGSPDTWFTGIYIKVTDAPIKINEMNVYFDNGDKFSVSLRSMIKEGGHSRSIELPGGTRKIKQVEFSYETLGSKRGHAHLSLWGKY